MKTFKILDHVKEMGKVELSEMHNLHAWIDYKNRRCRKDQLQYKHILPMMSQEGNQLSSLSLSHTISLKHYIGQRLTDGKS